MFETTHITVHVAIAEAADHGLPVLDYGPKRRASKDFLALAEEFLEWVERLRRRKTPTKEVSESPCKSDARKCSPSRCGSLSGGRAARGYA